jgi:hypothetical protein
MPPDPNKRGGVSLDEDIENEKSGRGTMAEHGRTQQFTSDEARATAAYDGETGPPPIETPEQIPDPVPGRGAGGSPVDHHTPQPNEDLRGVAKKKS